MNINKLQRQTTLTNVCMYTVCLNFDIHMLIAFLRHFVYCLCFLLFDNLLYLHFVDSLWYCIIKVDVEIPVVFIVEIDGNIWRCRLFIALDKDWGGSDGSRWSFRWQWRCRCTHLFTNRFWLAKATQPFFFYFTFYHFLVNIS